MPNIENRKTDFLTNELVEGLDMAQELDYYMKNGIDYVARGIKSAVEKNRKLVEQHKIEKAALIEKYEGMISVRALQQIKPFQLKNYISNVRDNAFSLRIMENFVTYYNLDLLVAEENEQILKHNTEVIDTIANTMMTAGISKTVIKYKSTRSSTKISVDAEWWKELKENYHSNHFSAKGQFTKTSLDEIYKMVLLEKQIYDSDKLANAAKLEKENQEAKAKQQEAILIAHTCIKFNFDPITIATRSELDTALINIGEVPASVIETLKRELSM